MANEALIKVEQAGRDYFRNHPTSNYATAERFARKEYNIAIARDLFVAGWNQAFWDEQSRVLRASTKSRIKPTAT